MGFFEWLEMSSVAHWVQVTEFGYPFVLTVHALGMGIVTGFSWMISVRLLGGFRFIPVSSLKPFFWIAWFGFIINALSGGALFASQAATNYIHNVPYLTKMVFVLFAAISIGYLHTAVAHRIDAFREEHKNDVGNVGSDGTVALGAVEAGEVPLTRAIRVVAGITMFLWLGAIISGRLIAYLS